MGYANVKVIRGGVEAWKKAGYKVIEKQEDR
jgi:rhodanese-related sulfurtransferase